MRRRGSGAVGGLRAAVGQEEAFRDQAVPWKADMKMAPS